LNFLPFPHLSYRLHVGQSSWCFSLLMLNCLLCLDLGEDR
jgi:hypothetical protein